MPGPIVTSRPPLALASSLPDAPTAAPPSLDTLPPELLGTIFSLSPTLRPPTPPALDPYAHAQPDAPLALDPACVAVSRALLPAARASAYACATVRGARSLEKLERTVTAADSRGGARLGALVRVLEVVDGRAASPTAEHASPDLSAAANLALERTARATLDALGGLEHLVVACPGAPALQRALLSRAALSAGPFAASASPAGEAHDEGVRLSVLSGGARPVCVADLDEGVRGAGPRLRAVEVVGRMGLKRGEGERALGLERAQELGLQGGQGVERVVMEVEGHAQGASSSSSSFRHPAPPSRRTRS